MGAARAVGPIGAESFRRRPGRAHLADNFCVALGVIFRVVIVITARVAGLPGAFFFFLKGPQNSALNGLAAGGIDRVRDVGVEFRPAISVAQSPILVQACAALVAVAGAQMVLAAALRATVSQFTARHGHELALGAFDDLQIANDESIVKRDGAEGLQPFVVVFHELDSNFGDNHR